MPKVVQQEIPFPLGGLSEFTSYENQPAGGRDSLPTTASCLNVRGFDPRTGRARGGQRSGQSRYLNAQITGAGRIQDIIHVTQRSGTPSATNQALRVTTALCVSAGRVARFDGTSFTTVTNGASALSSTVPQIFSVVHFQKIYFVDGSSYKTYDPATDEITTWEATDELDQFDNDGGEMPLDGVNRARLIEVWRGRIVLSGVKSDPHNWFMSAAGYPLDWNYLVTPTCPTQAVAGNTVDAGKCPDIVNAMIPFNDDRMFFGGDHSLWMLTGDPMETGRFDRISETIGIAFGRAWCISPEGLIYFFSTCGGVYRMAPGSQPERISANIEERLADVNLDTHTVRLAWNDREQGVHVFISPLTTGSTTHYFFDARNSAWWPDSFANTSLNPTCVHVLDGDDPEDRVLLLGGQDGRIRLWDIEAAGDDDSNIASHVYLGPFGNRARLRGSYLREMQIALGATSDDVDFAIYAGDSAEEALASGTAKFSGELSAGHNKPIRKRCRGGAIYLKLSNSSSGSWAFESCELELGQLGNARA